MHELQGGVVIAVTPMLLFACLRPRFRAVERQREAIETPS